MTDDWKDAVKNVNPEILAKLHIVACEQSSSCDNRYFNKKNVGNCAECADTAESIIGHYLLLISS